MTLQIKLSMLTIAPEEFAARVKAFVERLEEYARHLEGVKADAANPDLKPEDRRVAFPPPSEDDLIAKAAHEGYELQGPTLEEKKAALTEQVRRIERETHEKVMPPAKRRHWDYRHADIVAQRDAALRASQVTGTLEITVGDDDDRFMNEMTERREKVAAVSRWVAKHEHDISDLTEDNVDHYVIGGTFN